MSDRPPIHNVTVKRPYTGPEPELMGHAKVGYPVARKTYWRTASVIAACHAFNANAPRIDDHWFEASWSRKWWGGKRMTLYEYYTGKVEAIIDSRLRSG